MNCKNHEGKLASYQCGNCKNAFCEACVIIRRFTDEFTAYVCKECGGKCDLILAGNDQNQTAKPKLFAPKPKEIKTARDVYAGSEKPLKEKPAVVVHETHSVSSGYWPGFFGAFVFPFRGTGIFKMILAAVLFYGLSELSRISPMTGMGLSIPCLVYLTLYLFRIVEDTLKGENRLPKLPDLNYWVEEAGIIIYFAFGFVAYLAPANVYFILTKSFDPLYAVMLGAGVAAIPVMFVRIAVERKLSALHPAAVFSAIARTFVPYSATLIVLSAFKLAIFYVNDAFLYEYDWLGFLGLQLLIVYKLFVDMRILGVFGRSYQERITARPKGKAA